MMNTVSIVFPWYARSREKTLTIISDTQSICRELAFYYYLLFNFLCYAYSYSSSMHIS